MTEIPQKIVSASTQYILAIVSIVGIAVGASAAKPEQAISTLSFCGSVLIALLALLKGQVETHQAVNSKMDLLLSLVASSERAKGLLEGREQQKVDDQSEKDRP